MAFPRKTSQRGLTMIELSIVLAIIAIIMGTSAPILSGVVDNYRVKTTRDRLDYIQKALDQFVLENGYLPCPADGTVTATAATFGVGTGTGTNPADCSAANTVTVTNNIAIGSLPVVNLGLPFLLMADAWGQRFTYAVDEDLTFKSIDALSGYNLAGATGGITMQTSLSTPATISASAAYVVISHGSNRFGARPSAGGAQYQATAGGNAEDENADNDETFSDGPGFSDYDDLVRYGFVWQLGQDS